MVTATGPMRGKVGAFRTVEKNIIGRELQKDIFAEKQKLLAEQQLRQNSLTSSFAAPQVGQTTTTQKPSKYSSWDIFAPKTRETKMGYFRDKNAEIGRRQTKEKNTQAWMTNIKSEYGDDAQVLRQGSKIDVLTGFQKFKYVDDPMGYGQIQLKGVEAFTPEGYTKVATDDGFKILAGEKQYLTSKRRSGDKSKKDYGTYIPVEAILDKQGNLLKVVKRKDYSTYEESDDDGYERKKGVMVAEETIFENNRKKMSQMWDDYKKEQRDYESGRSKEEYGTYLKKVVDYTSGMQTDYNRPTTEYSFKAAKPVVTQQPQQEFKTTSVVVDGKKQTYQHSSGTGVEVIGGKPVLIQVRAPGSTGPAPVVKRIQ
jgi:hypothetical protein